MKNDANRMKAVEDCNLPMDGKRSEMARCANKPKVHPRKWPQYMAGLSANFGALSAGLVYGWTSPAGEDGSNLSYNFAIGADDFSWISSIFNVGAAAACVPVGMLTNLIGRRRSMLLMTVPFIVGWSCVIWANSIGTLMFGRFLLGVGGGAFCVAAPMYTAEIADKETRGRLGSYFELLLCTGILAAYAMGFLDDMHVQSILSASAPLIFFAVFFFMPESPTYHLIRGNVEAARETLVWLRGKNYDVEIELAEQRKSLEDAELDRVPLLGALTSRGAVRGLLVGYGLMFFQCFSGIDAIIFYADGIFRQATDGNSGWSTIVTATTQVTALFLFTLVIDKWGRRPLLVASGTVTCLSTLLLGAYFYLDENGRPMTEFHWIPILCISAFNIFISFGFDPVPWMMIGELFSPRIKGVAGSSACLLNWLMSFVVTKFYGTAKRAIGAYGTFWIFSAVCCLSVFFVILAVPETRGKTLDEIQAELNGASYGRGEKDDSLKSHFSNCYHNGGTIVIDGKGDKLRDGVAI